MANEDKQLILTVEDYSAASTGVVPADGLVRWFNNISTYTSSNTIVQIVGDGTSTVAQLVAAAYPVTPESTPALDYQAANKKYVDDSVSNIPLRWPDLIGCQCSPGTDSDHDIDITAGKRRDSTDTANLECPSGTAAIDATFDASTSTWGLYSGGSLSAGDTVHLMAVSIDSGGVGYYFDTDITGTNLPSGCTYFRRIGMWKIDSSLNLIQTTQDGNEFRLKEWLDSGASSFTTTATNYNIAGIPSGKKVKVICVATCGETTGAAVYWYSPDDDDKTISTDYDTSLKSTKNEATANSLIVRSNASGQLRAVSSVSTTAHRLWVVGWYDDLGAFDGV